MKMRHLVLAAVACVALPPLAATAATAPGESCQASEIYPQPPPAAFDRTANQPQPKQTAADLAKSLTALGDALQRRAQTDWADLCRYRAEDRALAASATPVRAVFLGDSITEYWRIADPALFSGGLVNRGIAGQTTPQILLRLRQDVIGLTPIAVVILAGTNDIMNLGGATTLAAIEGNISSMVELASAHGIAVVLAAVPPMYAPFANPPRRAAIAALNKWMRTYARQQVLGFVDYGVVLADKNGALNPELSIDGLHPNRAGFAKMRPLVEAALRRAIR